MFFKRCQEPFSWNLEKLWRWKEPFDILFCGFIDWGLPGLRPWRFQATSEIYIPRCTFLSQLPGVESLCKWLCQNPPSLCERELLKHSIQVSLFTQLWFSFQSFVAFRILAAHNATWTQDDQASYLFGGWNQGAFCGAGVIWDCHKQPWRLFCVVGWGKQFVSVCIFLAFLRSLYQIRPISICWKPEHVPIPMPTFQNCPTFPLGGSHCWTLLCWRGRARTPKISVCWPPLLRQIATDFLVRNLQEFHVNICKAMQSIQISSELRLAWLQSFSVSLKDLRCVDCWPLRPWTVGFMAEKRIISWSEFHDGFRTLRDFFLKTSRMRKEDLQARDQLHAYCFHSI